MGTEPGLGDGDPMADPLGVGDGEEAGSADPLALGVGDASGVDDDGVGSTDGVAPASTVTSGEGLSLAVRSLSQPGLIGNAVGRPIQSAPNRQAPLRPATRTKL